LFILAGIIIFCFAAILAAVTGRADGFFIFVIYLIFALIAFFAMKDLKKIKMITPDIDDKDKEQDNNDGPALVEDYFEQLESKSIYRRRLSNSPAPKWHYQPVTAKNKDGGKTFLIILTVIVAVFSMIFIAMFLQIYLVKIHQSVLLLSL
jgi:hypothetical protein